MFNNTENLVIYSAGINSVIANRVNTGTINYEIFGTIKHLPIKVNNNNTRKWCEIYSEELLTLEEVFACKSKVFINLFLEMTFANVKNF